MATTTTTPTTTAGRQHASTTATATATAVRTTARATRMILPCEDEESWKTVTGALLDIEGSPADTPETLDALVDRLCPTVGQGVGARREGGFFQSAAADKEFQNFDWSGFFGVVRHLRRLAADLKTLMAGSEVKFLLKDTESSASFTRAQVASMICLSFLGVMDGRTRPDIRLNSFDVRRLTISNRVSAVCVANYLRHVGVRMAANPPDAPYSGEWFDSRVVYSRKTLKTEPKWYDCESPLCPLKIFPRGSISHSEAAFHTDFANKYLGGGVLRGAAVQEEIMFVERPELLLGMAFMQVMSPRDAIVIAGAETHSLTTGYAQDLKFAGDPTAEAPDTSSVATVAIDAIVAFQCDQFSSTLMWRDIVKAFVGFQAAAGSQLATGNWGAGAFAGDAQLKLFQQWLAASAAGVSELLYYTFGDKRLANLGEQDVDTIRSSFPTVAALCKVMFSKKMEKNEILPYLLQRARETPAACPSSNEDASPEEPKQDQKIEAGQSDVKKP